MRPQTYLRWALAAVVTITSIAASTPAPGPAEQLMIISETYGGNIHAGQAIGPTDHRAEKDAKGRLAITTLGTTGCPVLPLTLDDIDGRPVIALGTVPNQLNCGNDTAPYTTVVVLPPHLRQGAPLFQIDGQLWELSSR